MIKADVDSGIWRMMPSAIRIYFCLPIYFCYAASTEDSILIRLPICFTFFAIEVSQVERNLERFF